jgi:hypothetical protein
MLSLNDFPMMNVCDVTNKRRKIMTSDNETSSKLWHCHLCHILRGRMERLIKDEILEPLDFSDLGHSIECIKEKYIKHIKKTGATRSSGILEIIHIDICGPFNMKSVNGFNSFIAFTDDFSSYGYIYPIRERSAAFDKFKTFKAKVDNQHNVKIKSCTQIMEENIMGGILLTGKFPDHLLNF